MRCPVLGWCSTVFLVFQCIESRVVVWSLVHLRYQSVSITKFCVRMILIVVRYILLTISEITQLGVTRGIIMHSLWLLVAKASVQTWENSGLSTELLHNRFDRLSKFFKGLRGYG